MISADDDAFEPIEVPASVLWKRTLLLTFISVGIGLGTGYFMGRSVPNEGPSAISLRQLKTPDRFSPPLPVVGAKRAGENPEAPDDEAPAVRAIQSWLAPEPDGPEVGEVRPTLMRLDEEPTLNSDKG
jgi:hypothetical protein